MDKKTGILLGLALVFIVGAVFILFRPQESSLVTSDFSQISVRATVPSEVLKTYTDPSGFTFDYPDNLSLNKKDTEDDRTYADITLSAKGIDGSLAIKITDSSFTLLEEWVKVNQANAKMAPKEVKLGNLKAFEIQASDRLLLGALDSGVLFTIEMPKIEEVFWNKVYNKVLTDFSFAPPSGEVVSTGGSSYSDVIFEGEEVIE